MGGIGSGRSSTRALVEQSLILDLQLMMKRNWVRDGQRGTFALRFSKIGKTMRLYYDLRHPDEAFLELNYRQFPHAGEGPETAQYLPLTFTEPNYGGRRWWMICDGKRVAKLYLPPGGSSFGTREAWGLTYASQRADNVSRAFSRLNRVQQKLGCKQRWGVKPRRPHGMWRSKFDRLLAEYQESDARCVTLMDGVISELKNQLQ